MLICVFCDNTYTLETHVCPECQDYKGLMELELAKKTYNFIAEQFTD